MKNLVKLMMVCVVSIGLWACQAPSIPTDVAKDVATKFINATTSGNYDEAFKYVDKKEFFAARSDDEWIKYYKAVAETMGPIVSIKLSRHQADDRFSGRFYTFQYSIKHENGFTKEIVTLIQQINTDKDLKIFAHRIEGGKLAKINEMY